MYVLVVVSSSSSSSKEEEEEEEDIVYDSKSGKALFTNTRWAQDINQPLLLQKLALIPSSLFHSTSLILPIFHSSSHPREKLSSPWSSLSLIGEVNLDTTSRVEREDTRIHTSTLPDPRVYGKEEVDLRIRDDRRVQQQYPAQQQQQQQQQQSYSSYSSSEERIVDTRYQGDYQAQGGYQAQTGYQTQAETRYPQVDLARESYRQPSAQFEERQTSSSTTYEQNVDSQLDITEREYRRRTSPEYEVDVSYNRRYSPQADAFESAYAGQPADFSYERSSSQSQRFESAQDTPVAAAYTSSSRRELEVSTLPRRSSEEVDYTQTTTTTTVTEDSTPRKMGYYDDEGQYHSFRRGVERAADRLLHPFQQDREEVVVPDERGPTRIRDGVREDVRIVEPRGGANGENVAIPCHFIRIGDILILQGRPCQVIRISVSPLTGQHRYLGVDLFTRQLQEESSFVSNPSSSVVVQTMLGPVYKTYRILDLREDGRIVAMTESGDVKQGLPVINQGQLFQKIRQAFSDGRGSVRALVINDGGRELVVDYKVIHGSRL
ncbi:hypothetical protein ASPZODRAFT_140663 [Penicilliopsis zonata CBS 506.65]|uniref:Translation elongation factor IF5A C-terminal domain-containing protein n=1 Tax=Penicilliopsis zonata CBS 506.65 TaxID=1073090 RepID=A0A1L9SMU0_9EURO|nr:hypothetical protein ASPZODRAFT_140663 [Penicilliopsis zonata CBS 506.65]OJJ48364.1 hypothetical protein ASPZODRAFT_140663 [Penicilliopsis zonata CBS 506.65]